jgi:glycerophosphoryl diester phosphodiesterase
MSEFDIQGHRGARGLAPENTLPAFEVALELGVKTLELDVVISGDGEVVVSHEPWMSSEICSHPDGRPVVPDEAEGLNIFEMTYVEVARYDCGLRVHPRFPLQQPQAARKPLLREVLELGERWAGRTGANRVRYNVETKSRPAWEGFMCPDPETFVGAIWREVERAGVADRFIIQSFDPRTLQEARRRALPVRLALLVEAGPCGVETEPDPLAYLRVGLQVLGFTPEIYSPDHRLVTESVMEETRQRGMQVIPWTVNERSEMERLRALGAAGLITDYPDRALGMLSDA